MKKKRGFTLVELMSVIVVLGIIIAIAIPVYNAVVKRINEKNYENQVSLIETAGAKYAEDTRYENFFVDDLVKDGYLNADKAGNVINPVNGKIMNCYIVRVKKENDNYYATYVKDKEYRDKNGCMTNIPNTLNNTFKIIAHKKLDDGTKEKINWSKTVWVNKDVELSAQVDSEYEINEVKWYKGYDQEYVAEGNSYTVTVYQETSLQQVYKATATVKEKTTGEIEEFSATIVISIDKIKPSFFNDDASNINDKWQNDKNYNIKAYDNQSNIYGYTKIDNRDSGCPLDKSKYSKKEYMKISTNGVYNICAIDNAGNTTLRDELKVDHIDNFKMDCEFEIIGKSGNKVDGNQWYIPNSTYPKLTLKLKSLAMGPSGVKLGISTENKEKYTSDYINTLANAFVTTEIDSNKKGVTYYGFVRSQSGNNDRCSIILYYEHTMKAANLNTTISSDYDKITIPYTKAEADSGIASETCYLYNSSNNAEVKSVVASSGKCTFTGLKNANVNNNYYVKIKSISKAGNEKWSSQSSTVTIPGYCTSGHINYRDGTICTNVCGGGTYNRIAYSKMDNTTVCSNQNLTNGGSACGNVYYVDGTTCSDDCGGTLNRLAYSTIDNTRCSSYDKSLGGTACGGKKYSSSSACTASCPTACDNNASTQSGTRTDYYISSNGKKTCNPVTNVSCSISCAATAPCMKSLRLCAENIYLNKGTGGVLIYTGKVDDSYTKIEYKIAFSKIGYKPGHCDIHVAAKDCGACNENGTVAGGGTNKDGFAPAACPVATWNNVFLTNQKSSLLSWKNKHTTGYTFTGTITLDNSKSETGHTEKPTLKDYHIRVQCFAPASAAGKLDIDKANSYIKVGN